MIPILTKKCGGEQNYTFELIKNIWGVSLPSYPESLRLEFSFYKNFKPYLNLNLY